MKKARVLAAVFVAWMLAGCASRPAPLRLTPHIDLQRMSGSWFIVAAMPNWFERRLFGMHDVYTPQPDGSIREDFTTYRDRFDSERKHFTVRITVKPGTHQAQWSVHFFGPISAPFLILYVSPRYDYALFGYPSRQLGWIYSRQPTIDEKTYQTMLRRFAAQGYDTSKFRRIVQLPSQLGKKGFTSPLR